MSRSSGGSHGTGHRVNGTAPASTRTRRNAPASGAAGWECVHVCVDDATRLAYVEVLADEKATTAVGFLRRAFAFYRRHGISVERVMTDNGSAYRSSLHALACRALGLRHLRTRPYRPRTNGKAERFIRTMLGGAIYTGVDLPQHRPNAPPLSTAGSGSYNHGRPHGSLSQEAAHELGSPS